MAGNHCQARVVDYLLLNLTNVERSRRWLRRPLCSRQRGRPQPGGQGGGISSCIIGPFEGVQGLDGLIARFVYSRPSVLTTIGLAQAKATELSATEGIRTSNLLIRRHGRADGISVAVMGARVAGGSGACATEVGISRLVRHRATSGRSANVRAHKARQVAAITISRAMSQRHRYIVLAVNTSVRSQSRRRPATNQAVPNPVVISSIEYGAMLEICGFAREGAYLPEWSVKVPS